MGSPFCTVVSCAETEQGIFDQIRRGHLDFVTAPWPSISSSARDLVKKMLCYDPKERISASEVLSKFPCQNNKIYIQIIMKDVHVFFYTILLSNISLDYIEL